jgi:hypothetical protein
MRMSRREKTLFRIGVIVAILITLRAFGRSVSSGDRASLFEFSQEGLVGHGNRSVTSGN